MPNSKKIVLIILGIILSFLLFSYFYYINQKKELLNRLNSALDYTEINCLDSLDNTILRTGSFKINSIYIERKDSLEIQKNSDTKKEKKFKILWISNCEYHLIPFNANDHSLRVKITSIEKNRYNCYISFDNNNIALKEAFEILN
ncbi:MAG: hypothetical protein IT250_17415 [Chitinophagaceae bacterium]|nr:hypothetical protein [Chitinophagaceae bacterium]